MFTTKLPTALYTATQVRQLDASLVAAGTFGQVLMLRAAQATFAAIEQKWEDINQLTVIAGGGKNGGDGYFVACLAKAAGWSVKVLSVIEIDSLHGDAKTAYLEALNQNVAVQLFDPEKQQLSGVLVDAILGTGCNKPVADNFKRAINAINDSGLPVCSVDIPSGLNANNGAIWGCAVKANITVTFIALKVGLLSLYGPEHCGRIYFNDLNTDAALVAQQQKIATRLCKQSLSILPRRARNAHKGDFGHALIIAGGRGMGGAALLSANAALRCGAGLVTLATQVEHAERAYLVCPELMSAGIVDGSKLKALAGKASVAALGPGLGEDSWAQQLLSVWTQKLTCLQLPQVWDADALNWLAKQEPSSLSLLKQELKHWVITPHPAEAARLLQTTTAQVQGNRIGAALKLAHQYQAVVVLKGFGTLIASPDDQVYLCSRGSPAMSGSGFGDVLTGAITAFLAQGMAPLPASCLAVYLHAVAGEQLGKSGRGVFASELTLEMRRQLQLVCPV